MYLTEFPKHLFLYRISSKWELRFFNFSVIFELQTIFRAVFRYCSEKHKMLCLILIYIFEIQKIHNSLKARALLGRQGFSWVLGIGCWAKSRSQPKAPGRSLGPGRSLKNLVWMCGRLLRLGGLSAPGLVGLKRPRLPFAGSLK